MRLFTISEVSTWEKQQQVDNNERENVNMPRTLGGDGDALEVGLNSRTIIASSVADHQLENNQIGSLTGN